jgi:alkyl sulfatase BDS1-like metallo-beta-lactamase superfamily hydrolase
MEIVDKLVHAAPDNQVAKDLLADVFEQLGYQYESTSMRNVHLAAANELRSGITKGASFKSAGPDVITAMTTQQWLEALAIRVDPAKAEGMDFTINLVTPDNGETYVVEMSNATLTAIEGYQADDADTTITVDRADLDRVMTGETTLAALIDDGTASLEGSRGPFDRLRSTLVQFDPLFEIMPGTKEVVGEIADQPFEQDVPYVGE